MNYIDVAKLMKQAAVPIGAVNPATVQARVGTVKPRTQLHSPKTPDNTFSSGIAAAQKQRQQQISNANKQYTQTTGKNPTMSNAQANQILDDYARQNVAIASQKRQEADARRAAFIAEQRAQANARAQRVNRTISAQQARDAAYRQQLAGTQPAAHPAAQPRRSAAQQSRINEAVARADREDAAIRNGTYKPRSGYMQTGNDPNQNAFGTRPAPNLSGTMRGRGVTASSKPANMRQGYKTPDGKWHEIA